MTRETVRLMNALTAAYKECLRQPQGEFRVRHQSLYAHLRDAIAELDGTAPEIVQSHFELLVATEGDDDA